MNLSGSPLDYIIAFFGGILMSFTPCVYPLIPVTAGYIGAHSVGSRLQGFLLSLAFVTGIALTYSALGLIASLTGSIFGEISSHPLAMVFAGGVTILFGLSMSGLFHIHLPSIIKAPAFKEKGYFSAFVLGLTSGLVVSPCLTPVLGSILFYLTAKKNLLYGATLLLSFAYGMGLLLLAVGTFSSLLVNLPKSGKWLLYIKRFCAFLLLGMGLFYLYTGIRRF